MNSPRVLSQHQAGFFNTLSFKRFRSRGFFRTFAGTQTSVNLPLHFVKRFPDLILRSLDSPPVVIPGLMGKGRAKEGLPSSHAMNTSSFIQVLGIGTDTGETAASVLLFFDRERYVFNAGEGFQRFAVEHKIKLNRLSRILVTRLTTDATGGLPGLALTMADSLPGKEFWGTRLKLVGPQGLRTVVGAFTTFVDTKNRMGFEVMETGTGVMSPPVLLEHQRPQPVVTAETVTIYPIVLIPPGWNPPADVGDDGGYVPRPRKRIRTDFDDLLPSGQKLDPAEEFRPVVENAPASCYVCQLTNVPGKLLVEKATELGVPRGPLFCASQGWPFCQNSCRKHCRKPSGAGGRCSGTSVYNCGLPQ
eukprot:jgi/Botrbrau1/4344/Bobra.0232s0033.1